MGRFLETYNDPLFLQETSTCRRGSWEPGLEAWNIPRQSRLFSVKPSKISIKWTFLLEGQFSFRKKTLEIFTVTGRLLCSLVSG